VRTGQLDVKRVAFDGFGFVNLVKVVKRIGRRRTRRGWLVAMDEGEHIRRAVMAAMQGSLERLQAAGLIEILEYDPVVDEGTLRFHPGYHRLLMAGRNPLVEPGFAEPLASGDLAAARAWVEAEAANLPIDIGLPEDEPGE
jgi:hypothetical protein